MAGELRWVVGTGRAILAPSFRSCSSAARAWRAVVPDGAGGGCPTRSHRWDPRCAGNLRHALGRCLRHCRLARYSSPRTTPPASPPPFLRWPFGWRWRVGSSDLEQDALRWHARYAPIPTARGRRPTPSRLTDPSHLTPPYACPSDSSTSTCSAMLAPETLHS